jgi:hydroxymethylglutaryl-CoA lyase
MSEHLEIVDVGPRDGIQSQPKLLSTETKLKFIKRLIDAGIRRLEVASFVNPKRVPQMADVDELIAHLPRHEDVRYIGLVMNKRGFERALASGIDQINCVVVTTDTFSKRNQGATREQTLAVIGEIAAEARTSKLFCGVTVAAAFGCPFEGEVSPQQVVSIVKRLADMGMDEIALADTIGAAAPSDVTGLIERVRPVTGDIPLRCHFHNTRNTGVANAYAALQSGVRILDASCGGLGGCPFAPAATGNVATEDILYVAQRMGFTTGVSIERIIDTTKWLEAELEAPMPAMVSRAGLFPPSAA